MPYPSPLQFQRDSFQARRPVTLAFMAVDWEENLGLGSERNRGQSHFPGDAGIVAVVQDAAGKTVSLTDASWRAQTFYVAPLADRACLVENGALRDSSACSTRGSNDGSGDAAAHWPLPANWMQPGFDDRAWPQAVEFSNDVVGVNGKPAYTNFTDIFDREGADAQFIWSSNLVLDNLVLLRGGFHSESAPAMAGRGACSKRKGGGRAAHAWVRSRRFGGRQLDAKTQSAERRTGGLDASAVAAHDGLADGQAEAAAALVPAACQFCAIEWLEEASQVCRGHAGRTVGDVDEDPLALALERHRDAARRASV